jgi:hypothetical protein
MFPLKYCGLWCLVYSTNPMVPHSTLLNIQYNRLNISPIQDYDLFKLKRTYQGVIRVDDSEAKIVWSKQVNYEIETPFLPSFSLMGKINCQPLMVNYTIDESCTYCTFVDKHYKYVFHRFVPSEKKDTFIKIFITQLVLDLIIRHI